MSTEAQTCAIGIYAIACATGGTCTIVAINNAGRLPPRGPGLNRQNTKYEILNTNCMQNKPNLLGFQMSVSSALAKDYENKIACALRRNKPNQTQFQICSKPAKK